jgi:hypothetical protein
MGRSLGSGSLQMISPQKAWLEPDVGVGGMSRTSCNTCEIADKLQKVHLGGHGEATRMTSRRARIKSRWSVRVRRRRVRLHASPRLPGSKLGFLLAKLPFSGKRARRIHSIQASYKSDEQAQPLLDCNPSIP